MATELAIALDFRAPTDAELFLKRLSSLDPRQFVLKVGLELFMSAGAPWVRSLTEKGHRIFLDLKFYDIPNTVSMAAVQAQLLNVDFFTLHLSGGSAMILATRQALLDETKKNPKLKTPKILGVSVLTSFSDQHWHQVQLAIGSAPLAMQKGAIEESVMGLVSLGFQSGVDGIVCSPHEIQKVKKTFPSLLTVVPGIRLQGSDPGDQARIMTPKAASALGADIIVVGRPITQSSDPVKTIEAILKEISSAHSG